MYKLGNEDRLWQVWWKRLLSKFPMKQIIWFITNGFFCFYSKIECWYLLDDIKDKRNAQGVPQLQTAALPRHQEEEESDKTKQAQIEQTYEKH